MAAMNPPGARAATRACTSARPSLNAANASRAGPAARHRQQAPHVRLGQVHQLVHVAGSTTSVTVTGMTTSAADRFRRMELHLHHPARRGDRLVGTDTVRRLGGLGRGPSPGGMGAGVLGGAGVPLTLGPAVDTDPVGAWTARAG